jgi:hypothetical protein
MILVSYLLCHALMCSCVCGIAACVDIDIIVNYEISVTTLFYFVV